MGVMKEKEAEDYDLERFIEMFDTAMTSRDPRVKQALRQLMMMVILTDSGDHEAEVRERDKGPLQEMFNDLRDLRRRVHEIERRMLSSYPREEETRPRGYNLGGQGGPLHPQWPNQSLMEKLSLHGNDPWTLNKTQDKGF